jgi:hypothetical protein
VTDSAYYLKQLVTGTPDVEPGVGASGYFSAPQDTLDPNLFDAKKKVRFDVRNRILAALYAHWAPILSEPRSWSTVWLSGSAASYQWHADRGNGDLDILIGIDWYKFFAANEKLGLFSPEQAADAINTELRSNLWPTTAATKFGAQTYEMTFYVNPLGSDIKTIHAYAAYDLTHNRWTVLPPELPADPTTLYDSGDWQAAAADKQDSAAIREAFNRALNTAKAAQVGSAQWRDATNDLNRITAQARTLFDAIHLGRQAAFAPTGEGYSDVANFRWQAAKARGVIDELGRVKDFDFSTLNNPLAVAQAERAADLFTRRALRP